MKVLIFGNSHIAMLQQARADLPAGASYVFAPVQFYEGERTVLQDFLTTGSAEFTVKEKYSHREVAEGRLQRDDFDLLMVVGLAGGPGDAFRSLAPASFTGNLTDVPAPEEVGCPVCAPDVPAPGNPPVSRGVLRAICAAAYDRSLSRFLAAAGQGRGPAVVVIPTPPMPVSSVIRRFGATVQASETGTVLLEAWQTAAARAEAASTALGVVPVPAAALERGWLRDSYLRGSEPAEIHANADYIRLQIADIARQIDRFRPA
jgi:hypothetical protein